MSHKPFLLFLFLFSFNFHSQAQESPWGGWTGLDIWDLESNFYPNVQLGATYSIAQLAPEAKLEGMGGAGFSFVGGSFGTSLFLNFPLGLNLCLGFDGSNYDTKMPFGIFAGLGAQGTYINQSGEDIFLLGPYAQAGLNLRINRNAYFLYGRLQELMIPNDIAATLIHIGFGKKF